jgi:hypothetical protein
MRLEAWRVHDTGLVAAPGRFRRLGGLVRHHQGEGAAWPEQVTLELSDDVLTATASAGAAIGSWPCADVRARRLADGPPVSFILEVPGAPQLLAAAGGAATAAFLAALSGDADRP